MIKKAVALSILLLLSFPGQAQAIIFIPALILIPIAKILAIIVGALSVPTLGLAGVWHKVSGTPLKKTLLVGVGTLVVVGLAIAVFLRIQNPDRPVY